MRTTIPVPTINANDAIVVVVRWHGEDGGRVERGAPLVDVETTKAVVTLESEQEGWLRRRCRAGDEVAVGSDLAWVFSTPGEAADEQAPALSVPAESVPAPAGRPLLPPGAPSRPAGTLPAPEPFGSTRLSPAARALLPSLGLRAGELEAANLGLVTSRDLRAQAGSSGLRRERLSPSKRAEIQALREGAGEGLVSSVTLYFDSAGLRAAAPGASLLPVILAEAAPLLAARPAFTAFFEEGAIVYQDAVHFGVAMDLGQGLRVVTVAGAATLDAAAIGRRLEDLALAYVENRLQPGDVQGATFTVTDLSALDVMHFEPLINSRQAAILGIGGDSTLPGFPVSLTLAFDHRVLNGREAAEFLRALRDRLLARGSGPGPSPAAGPACCDRCLIDVPGYYEKFGKWGVMHTYARPDGGPGLICHSCLASL